MKRKISWLTFAILATFTIASTTAIGQSSIVTASPDSAPISVNGVIPALKAFFGSHQGRYIAVGGSLYDQFVEVYRGPSDKSITLENGDIFTSATRPQDGSEKAAAIFDPFGKVIAAAIISHHCSFAQPKLSRDSSFYSKNSSTVVESSSTQSQCDSRPAPTMTIFLTSEPISPVIRKAFRNWARQVLVQLVQSSQLDKNSKIRVERKVFKK